MSGHQPFASTRSYRSPESEAQPVARAGENSWWASLPFLRAFWRKRFEARADVPALPSRADSNFRLLDVLAELSEILAADQTLTPESLLQDHSPRFRHLQELITVQLQAAVKEHLRLPHHRDANEIDLAHYALGGDLRVFHRNYPEKDLIERSDHAARTSTGAVAQRYHRESQQLRLLYQRLLPELSNLSSSHWTAGTAAQIAPEIAHAYHLKPTDTIFLGQRHGFSMPINTEVYPEGMSYLNIVQLAYIPDQQRILVLTDQWYSQLSLEDHRTILREWDPSVLPHLYTPTEAAIMETVVTLPPEVKDQPLFEVFQELAARYGQHRHTSDGHTDFAVQQQTALGKVAQQKQDIHNAATFLTQVLLTEYLVCLDHPDALTGLPARLQNAFEVVAHPLFDGRAFAYEPTKRSYFQTHLQHWLDKPTKRSRNPNALAHQLRESQRGVIQHGVVTTSQDTKRRNSLISDIAKNDKSILTRLLSEASCASGKFGGLEAVARAPGTANLTTSVLNGHLASSSELAHLIGAERARDWKLGTCVNPHCHSAGVQQLVGECNLCLQCELLTNLGKLPNGETHEGERSAKNAASQLAGQNFAHTRAARSFFETMFLGIDELPAHFLATERVLTQVR